jgi:MoaA/NifB/PqqE/SkfB family radical SAM enzyme
MLLTPSYILFQYTNLCNSRCTTCRIWDSDGATLSTEMVRRIGRFVDTRRLKEIFLTGGEPLLPQNAIEVPLALHEWHPQVAISGNTNGLCPELFVSRAKAIKEAGVWYSQSVSLNGLPGTHLATRGVPGGYEKAVETAKGLREIDALHSLNLLEVPGITTEADRQHVTDLANTLGVRYSASPNMRYMPRFNMPDDQKVVDFFDCHAVEEVICITAHGEIIACEEPRDDLRLGNLADERLNDDDVLEVRLRILARECQPCGCCCLGAFRDGYRCLT